MVNKLLVHVLHHNAFGYYNNVDTLAFILSSASASASGLILWLPFNLSANNAILASAIIIKKQLNVNIVYKKCTLTTLK